MNKSRRNEILEMVPEGVPITRSWLLDKELSRHTIDNLLKAKQLELLAKGIYIRNRSRMTWQSVVYSLQYIQKKNALIGGWKALELQGFHHYLNLTNKDEIQIFTDLKIPNWVHQMIPDVQFIVHHHHELAKDDNKTGEQKSLKLSREDFIRKHKWREVLEELKISSPERAFMEVLLDVPHRISFEHADQLMKGMTSLSPVSVQLLLELCTSIKVKRLFLWFAGRQSYSWVNKIDERKINLGSGKRMIEKNGVLDAKYQITVPSNL